MKPTAVLLNAYLDRYFIGSIDTKTILTSKYIILCYSIFTSLLQLGFDFCSVFHSYLFSNVRC